MFSRAVIVAVYRRWRRNRWDPMPARFHELARYNSDRGKYLFSEAYETRMAELQADFDAWRDQQMLRYRRSERPAGA